MNLSNTQLANLKELYRRFTHDAFTKYSPHGYSYMFWYTSIGGFAANEGIGGLYCDNQIVLARHLPMLDTENEFGHDALNITFGDEFMSIFYNGSLTFDDARAKLYRYIQYNTLKQCAFVNDILDNVRNISGMPERTEAPDELLKVYDTVDYNTDAEPYDDNFNHEGCTHCEKAESVVDVSYGNTDAEPYVNYALDPHDFLNYPNSSPVEEMFPDDNFTYAEYCAEINNTLAESIKAHSVEDGVTYLQLQLNTHPDHVYFLNRVVQDYTSKGYDVYINQASTRIIFVFH
jgi:hypothetical protein